MKTRHTLVGCHWPGFGVRIAEPVRKPRQKVVAASLYAARSVATLQLPFRFFHNQRCPTGTPPAGSFLRQVLNRMLVERINALQNEAIEASKADPAALQRYRELQIRKLELEALSRAG